MGKRRRYVKMRNGDLRTAVTVKLMLQKHEIEVLEEKYSGHSIEQILGGLALDEVDRIMELEAERKPGGAG